MAREGFLKEAPFELRAEGRLGAAWTETQGTALSKGRRVAKMEAVFAGPTFVSTSSGDSTSALVW